MKLSRLELEAFGPFAGHEVVDFDALAPHGLFLLNGATGSGKTSVLDAICYALYGQVPGQRAGQNLRSDHAGTETGPWVSLEFTTKGRRLKIRRDLPWERPKQRGTGTTPERAKALLQEHRDGQWQTLSTRNDEVGQSINELLGMTLDQFCRVVLLPQGEFASFLRADAKDREELLQKLFNTGRFEAIETAMAELSRKAAEEVAEIRNELAHLSALAASETPHENAPTTDESNDEDAEPEDPWAGLLDTATAAAQAAHERTQSAQTALHEARTAAEDSASRLRRHQRLAELRERQEAHERHRADADHAQHLLARHAQAQTLAVPLHASHTAAQAHATAQAALATALEALGEERLQGQELTDRRDTVHQTVATLAARLNDETQLQHHRTIAEQAQERMDTLEQQIERTRSELGTAQDLAGQITTDLDTLTDAPAALAGAEQELAAATQALKLHHQLAEALAAEPERVRAREEATSEELNAKSAWLDVRQERQDSAAALLAATLRSGEPCLVCGSVEHPHPATGQSSTEEFQAREDAAEAALQRAQEHRRTAEAALLTHQESIKYLRQQGAPVDGHSAQQQYDHALAQREHHQERITRQTELQDQLATVHRTIESLKDALGRHTTELATQTARHEAALTQEQSLSEILIPLMDGHPSLTARHTALSAELTLLDTAARAHHEEQRTHQEHTSAALALEEALNASDFATAEDLEQALLSEPERATAEATVQDWASEEHALAHSASDPDIRAAHEEAAHEDCPTLPELQDLAQRTAAAQHSAEDLAREAEVTAALADKALGRIQQLHTQHEDLLETSRPKIERADRLERLASALRGGRGDNTRRMSLATYILAARLEQVAEAASLRLTAMSDGRFTLEHTDERERRGARSGLGLTVLDGWTGQRRHTATLSGGESFIASLALALGLADVVQEEAGGTQMESLFIDEGFGTLDEQALAEVMDSLEGLIDGGRLVGLVSHVAELKLRIPAQVILQKGRTGSHIRMGVGTA